MSVDTVREYLKQFDLADQILEFDVSSATVDLAAQAVGVEGARICKTLSFKSPEGALLIQMAGDAKVDNRKFKDQFGYKAKMLSAEEVIAYTGHPIGGVCAFAIADPSVEIFCDQSLRRFETVFPACGSGNSAIELTPDRLYEVSRSRAWIDVTKLPEAH